MAAELTRYCSIETTSTILYPYTGPAPLVSRWWGSVAGLTEGPPSAVRNKLAHTAADSLGNGRLDHLTEYWVSGSVYTGTRRAWKCAVKNMKACVAKWMRYDMKRDVRRAVIGAKSLSPWTCQYVSSEQLAPSLRVTGVDVVLNQNSRWVGPLWAFCNCESDANAKCGSVGQPWAAKSCFPCARNPMRTVLGSEGLKTEVC